MNKRFLEDLLQQLLEAKEGNKNLDYQIHTALGWEDCDQGGWINRRTKEETGEGWPNYTKDLNEAMKLVLKELLEISKNRDAKLGIECYMTLPERPIGIAVILNRMPEYFITLEHFDETYKKLENYRQKRREYEERIGK